MRTILCAGGAGYIGAHTSIQLANTGRYKVIIVDNLVNSEEKAIEVIKKLSPPNTIEFVRIDLCTDFDELLKLNFDAVIHFAALKAVGESVEQPLRYYRNNLNAQINIFEACRQKNCNYIVFSSSATVYQPNDELLTETSPIGASNPYGQTKVMGEQILRDFCVANPNLRAVALRYFNPIGAHPSGEIGESSARPMNILPIIQNVAVGLQKEVNVMGNDWPTRDGTGVRDYIHVMDLADGHVLALDRLFEAQAAASKEDALAIYNLGTGKGVSVLEMIKTFESVNGVKIPYKITGRRPGDLSSVVCSPKQAEECLGFRATRTVEDACASAWKWQSTHPHGFRQPPSN